MDTQEQQSLFWTDEPEAPARLLPLGEQVANLEAELRNAKRQVGRLEATVDMLRQDNGSNIDVGMYWYKRWHADRIAVANAIKERDEALRKLGAHQSMGVFTDARVAALEMDLAYEMNARLDAERKIEEVRKTADWWISGSSCAKEIMEILDAA